MGYPIEALTMPNENFEDKEGERERNCWIGNGFHCPSISIFLWFIVQAAKEEAMKRKGQERNDKDCKQRERFEAQTNVGNSLSCHDPRSLKMHPLERLSKEKLLEDIFLFYDKDKDGHLRKEESLRLFNHIGYEWNFSIRKIFT